MFPAQTFSHYPAWPAPVQVPLVSVLEHACSYLPGRMSQTRAFLVSRMPGAVYQRLMDAGFRRSGRFVYQPICRGCRACVPIRVPVATFKPSKSQRRCARKNADLVIGILPKPQPSDEKYELYLRYIRDWHGRAIEPGAGDESRSDFERFLYESPVDTIEFEYRDCEARLLAVGICDLCPMSLSSVYFYFDPAQAWRGLGTAGVLREIAYARSAQIPYYYLGYWVHGCSAMQYKASYRPNELLGTDGVWRASLDPQQIQIGDRPDVTGAAGFNRITNRQDQFRK